MGLGGAIYPAFFLAPVAVLSLAYQILAIIIKKSILMSKWQLFVISLAIPFFLISATLVLFCPMDESTTFIGYFLSRII